MSDDSESFLEPTDGGSLLAQIARVDKATDLEDLSGRSIGAYDIRKRIGAGGMGVVYEALHRHVGRSVAIKLLPPSVAGDEGRRRRLLREARVAASLDHPHIARVLDAGEADGQFFIAMELVHGETLRDVLLREKKLEARAAVRLVTQLAEAVGYAHDKGIVHRDLKPDNVMIADGGAPKLLDFGLARFSTTSAEAESLMTSAGDVVGTAGYMSPEQARGIVAGKPSDVFALGVILYELVAGERPFRGPTRLDVLAATSRDDPARLSKVVPDLALDLDAVTVRCLAKAPEDRFADGSALAAALERTRGSKPAALRPFAPSWIAAATLFVTAGVVLATRTTRPPATHQAMADEPEMPVEIAGLACPVWEATDDGEAAPWLGAAAAHLACARIEMGRPVDAPRTRVPAELLGVSSRPEEVPSLVYDITARGRSLGAAASTTVLDGSVMHDHGGFVVSIELTGSGITRRTSRSDSAPVLTDAVWQALARLGAPGLLYAEVGSPEMNEAEASASVLQGGSPAVCARLRGTGSGLSLGTRQLCDPWLTGGANAPRVDPAVPSLEAAEELFLQSAHAAVEGPASVQAELAERIEDRRRTTSSPRALARLDLLQAELAARRNEPVLNRVALALSAIARDPRLEAAWGVVVDNAQQTGEWRHELQAALAWSPALPFAWMHWGLLSREDAALGLRRAFVLAPLHPMVVQRYGLALLDRGERSSAKALAGRLRAENVLLRPIGAHLATRIEAAEGRVAAAIEMGVAALRAQHREVGFGSGLNGDARLLELVLDLALVAGRRTEVSDALVDALVLESSRPLLTTGALTLAYLAPLCAFASEPRRVRCIERLETERGSGRQGLELFSESLDAAAAYVRGDVPAAASAIRRLQQPSRLTTFAVELLDLSGDDGAAAAIDEVAMKERAFVQGIGLGHVRAARRALRRGDQAAAARLARDVTSAWSSLDARSPLVDEMRAIQEPVP